MSAGPTDRPTETPTDKATDRPTDTPPDSIQYIRIMKNIEEGEEEEEREEGKTILHSHDLFSFFISFRKAQAVKTVRSGR